MATPTEIFAEIDERIKGQADSIKDEVDGTFKFVLNGDGGGSWVVNCKDEVGVSQSDGGADCELTMDADVFVQIYEGTTDGMQAFMMGQITLSEDSDMALAMKLQTVLESE